jgi:hypothetical protein
MQQFNTAIASVLSAIASGRKALDKYNEGIRTAREACAGQAPETIRAALLPLVAAKYGVGVVDGERKAKGTKVLDASSARYNTAKSDLQRILKDLCGSQNPDAAKKPSKPTKVRVSAAEREAFKAFLAACGDQKRADVVYRALRSV